MMNKEELMWLAIFRLHPTYCWCGDALTVSEVKITSSNYLVLNVTEKDETHISCVIYSINKKEVISPGSSYEIDAITQNIFDSRELEIE